MNRIEIENKTVEHCLKNPKFNESAYQIDLEHFIEYAWYNIQKYTNPENDVAKLQVKIKKLQKYYDEWTPETDTNDRQSYLDDMKTANDQIELLRNTPVKKISVQRIKDLVQYTLEIKQKNDLKQIQEKMLKIDEGDKENHLLMLDKLNELYAFNKTDIMKLSCWLTQVKRTAYNKEIKSPTALVFYSPQKETGKSTFMTLLKKAVLSSYQNDIHLKNFSIERLFTRFKPAELINDLVISIDEIGWMNKDISAELKSLITETNEIEIEKKFKDPVYSRKLANFIITTNDDPADLFYTDAHERRLSVIDNFTKIKNISENALYGFLTELWNTTPIEYAFDTNTVRELNLNRVRSNDEVFEALRSVYNFDYSDGEDPTKERFTILQLHNRFKELKFDINKKLIKSYLETSNDFFAKKQYGRITYYYMTQNLINHFDDKHICHFFDKNKN